MISPGKIKLEPNQRTVNQQFFPRDNKEFVKRNKDTNYKMNTNTFALIEMFDCDETANLSLRWTSWVNRLERYFVSTKLENDAQRVATLFLLAGERVSEIHDTLPVELPTEAQTEHETEYKKALYRLNKHFNPQKNKMVEQFKFAQTKQIGGETIDQYVTRLKVLAKYCEFTDKDHEIAKQVILHCESEKYRRKLLAVKDIKLARVLDLGLIHDTVETHAKVVEGKADTEGVNAISRRKKFNNSYHNKSKPSHGNYQKDNKSLVNQKERKCFNCGGKYPHERECPAKGKECRKCGKLNHFSNSCKRDQRKEDDRSNKVESVSGQEEEEYIFAISDRYKKTPKIDIEVLGIKVSMKLDTGCCLNILDELTFNRIRPKPKLVPYDKPSYGYQGSQELTNLGRFKAKFSCNGTEQETLFVVMKGGYGNLMGYETMEDLKLINWNYAIKTTEKEVSPAVEYWKKEFPTVFTGKVGLMKDYLMELHIDKSVKPVQANPRNKPFHLRKAIEIQLAKKLEDDVIEEVTGEPTEWLNEIVCIPKGNGEDITKFRLCIDMKAANVAIQSEKYQMPNVEDIIYQANGMKIFSSLDNQEGFEAVMLHPKSRYITKFRTHKGIYQSKRLCYGVKSAPEIYNYLIQQAIKGIEGVLNATDDILIMGTDLEENKRRIRLVLQRLESKGLTVNEKKCKFYLKEITFFGLRLSENGVSLNEQKMEALQAFVQPSNASELHSFLGLSRYASRWLKDLSTISDPLWKLTRDNVEWVWKEEHAEAFSVIKSTLIERVGYFKLDWITNVWVDASPVGLGGMLTQTNPEDPKEETLVICVSRTLTTTERKYSQIEKEALGVKWICKRLELYLLGKRFRIHVDNRAVMLILNNPLSKPPARILKWALDLSVYDMEVVHIPGKGNMADFLSRHPVANIKDEASEAAENYINMVIQHATPKGVKVEQLKEAVLKDLTMIKLGAMIKNGHFDPRGDEELQKFAKVFEELTVSIDGLILRDVRLVIPKSLRSTMIDIAHEGHLGLVKTKQLLRSKIWFPNIDALVEEKIKSCLSCQATGTGGSQMAPLQMSPFPKAPWTMISVDFYGPFGNGEYLGVSYDEYSKFPVVEHLYNLKEETVELRLETQFGIFGIPEEVRTDNGPPFNSEKFKHFAERLGFRHRKITPLWPRADGQVERFMPNLTKVIQTAKIDKIPWKKRLNEFLRNYRSTPHASTKVAPADLMFRNAKLVRFPMLKSDFKPNSLDLLARRNDKVSKERMKEEGDARLRTKVRSLKIGDSVLVKQKQLNKHMSKFDPIPYKVSRVQGSMITAERENHIITRNVSYFKSWHQPNHDKANVSFKKPVKEKVTRFTRLQLHTLAEEKDIGNNQPVQPVEGGQLREVTQNNEINQNNEIDQNDGIDQNNEINQNDEITQNDELTKNLDSRQINLDLVESPPDHESQEQAIIEEVLNSSGLYGAASGTKENDEEEETSSNETVTEEKDSKLTLRPRKSKANYSDARPYNRSSAQTKETKK